MARIKNINSVDFEVIKSDKTHWYVQDVRKHSGDTLANHYTSWSGAKQSAYDEWRNFFIECEDAEMFGVLNGNTYTFTCGALYSVPCGTSRQILGAFIITPAHNRLYLYK